MDTSSQEELLCLDAGDVGVEPPGETPNVLHGSVTTVRVRNSIRSGRKDTAVIDTLDVRQTS